MSNVDGAFLASLSIRVWQGVTRDAEITETAAAEFEMRHGNLTAMKRLIPTHYLREVNAIAQLGRTQHYRFTVPGIVEGTRLLSVDLYETYLNTMRTIKADFEQAVEGFVQEFPLIVAAAPDELGRAFHEQEYPTAAQIKSHFSLELKLLPVPDVQDWRIKGISSEDAEAVRAAATREVEDMYQGAIKDLTTRAHSMLEKVHDQIKTFNPAHGGSKLKEPTIKALKEMAQLTVAMNVANDPHLKTLGEEMISKFDALDATKLREDASRRTALKDTIADIMGRL